MIVGFGFIFIFKRILIKSIEDGLALNDLLVIEFFVHMMALIKLLLWMV